MKKFLITLFLISYSLFTYSQDEKAVLTTKISEAKSHHTSGNLEEAHFALEEALVAVDNLIGKLILDKLPTSINEFQVNSEADEHVATTAGFAGVYVLRKYEDKNNSDAEKERYVEFSLVNDSPFFGMVNAFLSNPLGGMIPGQKRIKIDGYKAMFQEEEDSDPKEYTVLLPFNQSLITMKFVGVGSETDAIGMANKFPIKEIIEIAQ